MITQEDLHVPTETSEFKPFSRSRVLSANSSQKAARPLSNSFLAGGTWFSMGIIRNFS